jgi:formylmethanofuran dehydrogenase subunit C
VSGGLTARLKSPLRQRADFAEVLLDSWTTFSSQAMAERPVYLERDGRTALGDLFEIEGTPDGRIRFAGDLASVDRLGAGLSAGEVTVEASVGVEAGVGMSGGALIIERDAGARAGAAPLGHKRGMTGGELIIRGSAGPEAGAFMRRGLLVIGRTGGDRTGLGMIAGSVIVFGKTGTDTGLWSKRGSVVALGSITPPATYAYACTYQPIHLRLLLTRLQVRYGLSVQRRHLTGLYRRYSGDLAELGKGEILEWVSK